MAPKETLHIGNLNDKIKHDGTELIRIKNQLIFYVLLIRRNPRNTMSKGTERTSVHCLQEHIVEHSGPS